MADVVAILTGGDTGWAQYIIPGVFTVIVAVIAGGVSVSGRQRSQGLSSTVEVIVSELALVRTESATANANHARCEEEVAALKKRLNNQRRRVSRERRAGE